VQVVAHRVPTQVKLPHDRVDVVQLPDVHAGSTSLGPLQLVAPQTVPFGAVQPPWPSQFAPTQATGLAVQTLWGSCPAVTCAHFPTDPATLQARQPLHAPADELQQTPSTQFPERHARATVQAVPSFTLGAHAVPPTQYVFGGHPTSVMVLQLVAQTPPLQPRVPQLLPAVWQLPETQDESTSTVPEQVAAPQEVPFGSEQLPEPLQSLEVHGPAAQMSWGSLPAVTFLQTPTEPARLQALHPWQDAAGVSQHTPSTQLPPWHWLLALHAPPWVILVVHAVPPTQ
jgi:hypothetical protein